MLKPLDSNWVFGKVRGYWIKIVEAEEGILCKYCSRTLALSMLSGR